MATDVEEAFSVMAAAAGKTVTLLAVEVLLVKLASPVTKDAVMLWTLAERSVDDNVRVAVSVPALTGPCPSVRDPSLKTTCPVGENTPP